MRAHSLCEWASLNCGEWAKRGLTISSRMTTPDAIERLLAAARLEAPIRKLEDELRQVLLDVDPATAAPVLARLLVEYTPQAEAVRVPSNKPGKSARKAKRGRGRAKTNNSITRADVGAPDALHGSKTEALVAALIETPRTPIADLARIVYGDGELLSQKRLRSLLAALKRAKPPRVRNVGSGKWEVVPPKG